MGQGPGEPEYTENFVPGGFDRRGITKAADCHPCPEMRARCQVPPCDTARSPTHRRWPHAEQSADHNKHLYGETTRFGRCLRRLPTHRTNNENVPAT
jgi:hypothetical protein